MLAVAQEKNLVFLDWSAYLSTQPEPRLRDNMHPSIIYTAVLEKNMIDTITAYGWKCTADSLDQFTSIYAEPSICPVVSTGADTASDTLGKLADGAGGGATPPAGPAPPSGNRLAVVLFFILVVVLAGAGVAKLKRSGQWDKYNPLNPTWDLRDPTQMQPEPQGTAQTAPNGHLVGYTGAGTL
jgi:hypothetical protein